jgi:hypothetical protein
MEIQDNDPLAVDMVFAIHEGDIDGVRSLLRDHPELAGVRLRDPNGGTRTLLHVVTDWPGYFPHGPEVVHRLIGAGGDPTPRSPGPGTPRPRCTGRRAATTPR